MANFHHLSTYLFPVGPTSSIQPMKDGSIGIEKSKVFDVDTKTESQLFEFDLFFELVLLEILNMYLDIKELNPP